MIRVGLATGIQTLARKGINNWQRFPATADDIRVAGGGYGTWGSIWQFTETARPLIDTVGGINFVDIWPASTPHLRRSGIRLDDYSIGFDGGTTDSFLVSSGSSYDVLAGTSIAIYVVFKSNAAASANRFIASKGSATNYYLLRVETGTGHLAGYMRSLAGAPTGVVLAVDHMNNQWHDAIFFIDRTANVMQIITDLGSSAATDIAAIGTTSNSGVFSMGANVTIGTVAADIDITYTAVATGDIPALRANASTFIANMRKLRGVI
jgi:hypothetical protein